MVSKFNINPQKGSSGLKDEKKILFAFVSNGIVKWFSHEYENIGHCDWRQCLKQQKSRAYWLNIAIELNVRFFVVDETLETNEF